MPRLEDFRDPRRREEILRQISRDLGRGNGPTVQQPHVQDPDDHRALPHPELEFYQAPALGGPVQRKAKSVPRITVRFVGYRVRPLDPDNFAGSVKDLLDGLRHAGLIPGDEPWKIRLETEQEKVAHYAQEKTVISITQ
jgi:hypothetical protein